MPRGYLGSWPCALLPPGDSPPLHANRLIMSSWTDWIITQVQRGGEGQGRPSRLFTLPCCLVDVPSLLRLTSGLLGSEQGFRELGSRAKSFLEVRSTLGVPVVTHHLEGKAWITEKPSGPRAYRAFCRHPKGLHLSHHCGKKS